jgi:hypothetical protein
VPLGGGGGLLENSTGAGRATPGPTSVRAARVPVVAAANDVVVPIRGTDAPTPPARAPEMPVAPPAPLPAPAPAPSSGLTTGSTVGTGAGSTKGGGGLPAVVLEPAAELVLPPASGTRAAAAAGSVGSTADRPSTRPD